MNSDIIRLLPDSVANQIAAGEVIQRPASVIKELVENAVDAGANSISIVIVDAGRTLIQVTDNGCGMSPTDARMAFERHATSKITSVDDIYSLHTMGFRGEALASIAAVAQIEMRTMRKDDTMGSKILISESKFEAQEPAACVPGTTIMVKNIFFHMPARRKFLKKDNIELGHILREFERLALVNTDIDFTLTHNDTTLHQFFRGTLKQRIGALFGKNLESQLAHMATETSIVKIEGFIAMPRAAKKRGFQQFFFVNGRNMRHPVFHRAVMSCYEHLIAADVQPSYFINFEVEPSTIDVNIHPQKHEIKFENEQAIRLILEAAIRETLGKTQASGALDFDSVDAPDIPLFNPDNIAAVPPEDIDSDYNPFLPAADNDDAVAAPRPAREYDYRPKSSPVPHDWEQLYESFDRKRRDAFNAAPEPVPDSSGFFTEEESAPDHTPTCFQWQRKYIVLPGATGLRIISQHRAHVRILFDRLMERMNIGKADSQNLLFPEDFELSPAQGALLKSSVEAFEDLGFGISDNGKCRWSITAVPAPIQGSSPVEALVTVLDELSAADRIDAESLRRPLAIAMANAAAVTSGQSLTVGEMEAIIADLFRCADPGFTPDGQTIMTLIDCKDIDHRFEL